MTSIDLHKIKHAVSPVRENIYRLLCVTRAIHIVKGIIEINKST